MVCTPDKVSVEHMRVRDYLDITMSEVLQMVFPSTALSVFLATWRLSEAAKASRESEKKIKSWSLTKCFNTV